MARSIRAATMPKSAAAAGGQIRERVDVLATGQPDRSRQAAADRRVERPQVVGPDRRRRLAGADPAWLAARLRRVAAAPGSRARPASRGVRGSS